MVMLLLLKKEQTCWFLLFWGKIFHFSIFWWTPVWEELTGNSKIIVINDDPATMFFRFACVTTLFVQLCLWFVCFLKLMNWLSGKSKGCSCLLSCIKFNGKGMLLRTNGVYLSPVVINDKFSFKIPKPRILIKPKVYVEHCYILQCESWLSV